MQILQDDISFEDLLGRVHSLQYQHFRHFEVFEAMLRSEFKELPGARNVLSGQYYILNAVNHSPIDKDRWSDKVFPGTKLLMSAIIGSLNVRPGFCPRLGCDGRITAKTSDRMICTNCNLVAYPSDRDQDLMIQDRSIEDSQGNHQVQHMIELSPQPWLKQADHRKMGSSQNMSTGAAAEFVVQHPSRPMAVDTVGGKIPSAAQGASQVDGSASEETDRPDREQQEMALFRRIHFSSVPSLEFDELFDIYDLESTVYVSEGDQWRAYKIHWKGRIRGPALQVHCRYLSHGADGEYLHPSHASFMLSPFQGAKRITELTLIPAAMLPNEAVLRQDLLKRGWQYWNLGKSIRCLELAEGLSQAPAQVRRLPIKI